MRILIARTDAIGDTILTLPMASFLKKNIPQCKIAFVVAPKCLDLFESHPYVDEVWELDRGLSWIRQITSLSKKFSDFNPTHFFFVGGCQIPSLLACLKRVSFRGGLLSRWPGFFLLNRGVRQRRSKKKMHESHYNLQLLGPLDIPFKDEEFSAYTPSITLKEEEISQAWKNFQGQLKEINLPLNKELIFIHPGMTGHTLNWPTDNYARLIEHFEKIHPQRFLFVISHTPSDQRYVDSIKKYLEGIRFKGDVFYFDGSIKGLRHYMGVLLQAKIFVGPSTGTTHLANVLKIKTVALYPPKEVQHPERWRPFNQDPSILRIVLPSDEKMNSLAISEVIKEMESLLK